MINTGDIVTLQKLEKNEAEVFKHFLKLKIIFI